MSDVKPMTAQEIHWLRVHVDGTAGRASVLATLDAKDAEIAELRKQVETLRNHLAYLLPNARSDVMRRGSDTDVLIEAEQYLAAIKSTETKGEKP